MEKLPAPAESFAAMQQAFLCLGDPAVGGGSGGAAAAALGRSPDADRLTVCRAMATTYSAHAASIGASYTANPEVHRRKI